MLNKNWCAYTCTCFIWSFLKFHLDLRKLMDFIRDAVLTVSPNRQYRGRMEPTIPAIQGPVRKCSKIVNSEQKFIFQMC